MNKDYFIKKFLPSVEMTPTKMKTRKQIGLVLAALAVGILIYWASSSGKIFTMTKIPIEVKDELFGTTSIEWKQGFQLGLEYAASVAILLFASAFFFWRSGRKTVR